MVSEPKVGVQGSRERLEPWPRLSLLGSAAWSLVGAGLLTTGAVLLLMLLRPLVIPLVVALFLAVALKPVVDALIRRRVPPAAAALLGTLTVIAVGVGVTVLVVAGVASQWDQLGRELDAAVTELGEVLASAGLAGDAAESAQRSFAEHAPTLMRGVLPTLGNLVGIAASVAIGVFLTLFTCFFLLKDGRSMTRRVAGWLPLRPGVGERWFAEAGRTVRGYILGMTLLGGFNAVVVGTGGWILGLPLVGTIVIVTLLGNYVPYLGAWVAGAFAVLIALANGGVETALWMLLVVIVANGSMQTLLTPFAYGAALKLNPLVTLLVTFLGGLLAGALGAALAAPIAAIVAQTVRMHREPLALTGDPPGRLGREG
jgi:predicted PurR-regulated permease PerM